MRWVVVALLVGCGSTPEVDAGVDAGLVDAGLVDAGALDAGASDAGAAPTCSGVMAAVAPGALMAPGRGSDGYVLPTSDARAALERAVRALATGDWMAARGEAEGAGYRLCRGEGEEADLWLLAPLAEDEGHARVVLRPDGVGLVLEAPHTFFDGDTGAEAATLFSELGARALIISGTHRCASLTLTACDGTTSVCGGMSSAYPISDPAHDVDGYFQAAHVAVAESFSSDVVVSVHGMSGDGASLSDGTTAPSDGVVARLAAALTSRFANVTACNEGVGVPRDVRLCGTTNVQGRHVNASPDACGTRAAVASGRFVHLEQSRALRDDVPTVTAAFRDVFTP